MLRIVSCSFSPRLPEHRYARRELVLQRLPGRQEAQIQGHHLGQTGDVQVREAAAAAAAAAEQREGNLDLLWDSE